MESTSKLDKLLTTSRDKNETEDWIFSLTPMGVAFVFYVIFIMSTNIETKGLFLHTAQQLALSVWKATG